MQTTKGEGGIMVSEQLINRFWVPSESWILNPQCVENLVSWTFQLNDNHKTECINRARLRIRTIYFLQTSSLSSCECICLGTNRCRVDSMQLNQHLSYECLIIDFSILYQPTVTLVFIVNWSFIANKLRDHCETTSRSLPSRLWDQTIHLEWIVLTW